MAFDFELFEAAINGLIAVLTAASPLAAKYVAKLFGSQVEEKLAPLREEMKQRDELLSHRLDAVESTLNRSTARGGGVPNPASEVNTAKVFPLGG